MARALQARDDTRVSIVLRCPRIASMPHHTLFATVPPSTPTHGADLTPMQPSAAQAVLRGPDAHAPSRSTEPVRCAAAPIATVPTPRIAQRARANAHARPSDDTDAPAVRLLDDLFAQASACRASDIHIEPGRHQWHIRLRIDGRLHRLDNPPAHLRDAVTTRIKVLARLDIAQRRAPQDGRLRIAVSGAGFDEFRVSTLPTVFGEKVVLRRLDALPDGLDLTGLGFDATQLCAVQHALRARQGMVLVTGPTGSGKTLTLYTFMRELDRDALNLCTIEDPSEIELAGINQVSVNDRAGLGFAAVLRALLRQDPDVIMVGEIRDTETASVAINAAQTGHLLLATLHTNDAPATLARLTDLGVEPYNVAAAVKLITAQRLVRRLCSACRLADTPDPVALRAAGMTAAHVDQALAGCWQSYRPVGCTACRGTGFAGRCAIHQVVPVTAALQQRIAARTPTHALADAMRAAGLQTLRQSALARVRDGTTSLHEALAVTDDA